MKFFLRDLFIYLLVVFVLIAVFLYAVPSLTRALPNDYSRHHVITDVLNSKKVQPMLIVLGDSRTMFGIDASNISNNLPGKPLCYNLASVGQSYFESCHFISTLPGSIRHVLQFVGYTNFTTKRTGVNPDKAISLLMNGYQIDSTTRKLLKQVNPLFDQHILKVAFQGRIIIKSSMHVFLRKILDNETFADCYNDLYFPHIYTRSRHPQYPFYKLPCNEYDSTSVFSYTAGVANRVQQYLQKRNTQYHIIILPVNPDMCEVNERNSSAYINKLRIAMPGIDFINLSHALNNKQFYDAEHPNREGAEIISTMVADSLKSKFHF